MGTWQTLAGAAVIGASVVFGSVLHAVISSTAAENAAVRRLETGTVTFRIDASGNVIGGEVHGRAIDTTATYARNIFKSRAGEGTVPVVDGRGGYGPANR